MKEFEDLSKKGWRIVVWLLSSGVCIIQGAANDGEDWNFDVAGKSFRQAKRLALKAVEAPADAGEVD